MTFLTLTADLLTALPAAVPDPGDGTMPPGFEGFVVIMGWIKWLALGVAVIGLLILGATMAISSRRGEGMEIGGWLGRILIGVIIIASAATLVGFLVGT
ncbi:hypothetical protein DDQ50_16435 [Amnibacterium flavum]|uniref:Conjugal transfer protein TrbC n=2 Tax=Amnibacterium flavum TaxID=2173173 RepID=A0A2V1HKX0_9MICO|nr:hypothetical protein DDQ50_16435 [Amnibacterium flavum]